MANDLEMNIPLYGACLFGNGLTRGSGKTSAYPTGSIYTFEIRFRTGNASSKTVMFSVGEKWAGLTESGQLFSPLVNGGNAVAGKSYNDSAWHHLKLVGTTTGVTFFIDDTAVATGSAYTMPAGVLLTIGRHQEYGYVWTGGLDEFASWTAARPSPTFATPSSAYTGTESDLFQLYHFEDNLDSKVTGGTGTPATVPATPEAPVAVAGASSATVTLVAPADGRSTLLGFTVVSNPAGGVDSNADSLTLSHKVTGLTPGIDYDFTFTARNSVGPSAASPASNKVTPTSAPAVNNALVGGTGKVLFSPGNWDIGADSATFINAGVYFKFAFTGATCKLLFNIVGVTDMPKVEYRIDGTGPVNVALLAAEMTLAIPSETAGYPGHTVEFYIRATTRAERWGAAYTLTGIILAPGGVITKAGSRALRILGYGDSIFEGYRSLIANDDTVNCSNARQAYPMTVAELLGAEMGIISFSGQGWNKTGDGNVPVFSSTFNLIRPGVPRDFTGVDAIFINMGTNDYGGPVQNTAVTVLNALISATPSTTKIVLMRPFNANQTASLTGAIAACSAPSRVAYVDTAGFYNQDSGGDRLHPFGWEHINHIAPLVAAAVRPILAGAPALTTRTVTMTLRDATGALAANVSGVQVSVLDDPARAAGAVVRYQSSTQSTNASGVLSFTYQSTLAAGALCGVDIVLPSDKRNMAVSVAVA